MDEADIASDLMERELQLALRSRVWESQESTGHCLWCDKPLEPGLRWCDADCRDDWERAHAAGQA